MDVLPAQGLKFRVPEYLDLLVREGAFRPVGIVAETVLVFWLVLP
jgi:hypothetical protein